MLFSEPQRSRRSALRGCETIVAAALLFMVGAPRRADAQGQVAIQESRAEAPKTLKAAAPIDLTGYWVSIVSEDWRWRMITPDKGDFASVPLNAEGRKVGDNWDPAKDEAAGNQCKAYGVAAIMRVPTRVHVTWQDDNTLKIETDAGQQTRLLHFGPPLVKGAGTWQGISTAVWEAPGGRGGGAGAEVAEGGQGGGGRGPAGPRGGQLKVATTKMKAGYLRKNGAPYSDKAVVTEYFTKTKEDNGDEWLVVTTIVDDATYLTQPFITSSHFRKEPDNSKWSPTPCSAR
jgi:hypothetical protein